MSVFLTPPPPPFNSPVTTSNPFTLVPSHHNPYPSLINLHLLPITSPLTHILKQNRYMCDHLKYTNRLNNFRAYRGLFSRVLFEFPTKCSPPSEVQLETFSALLLPGDLMTSKADASGTIYSFNQILVISVVSEDVIRVGVILDIVIRLNKLMFIVSVHDAIRTPFRFFQVCPCDIVELVDYRNLADFKPLFKRDEETCFRFFLHHHVPTPI